MIAICQESLAIVSALTQTGKKTVLIQWAPLISVLLSSLSGLHRSFLGAPPRFSPAESCFLFFTWCCALAADWMHYVIVLILSPQVSTKMRFYVAENMPCQADGSQMVQIRLPLISFMSAWQWQLQANISCHVL